MRRHETAGAVRTTAAALASFGASPLCHNTSRCPGGRAAGGCGACGAQLVGGPTRAPASGARGSQVPASSHGGSAAGSKEETAHLARGLPRILLESVDGTGGQVGFRGPLLGHKRAGGPAGCGQGGGGHACAQEQRAGGAQRAPSAARQGLQLPGRLEARRLSAAQRLCAAGLRNISATAAQ